MIGKVITGKSFGGCIRYVVQKQDAVILDAAGVRIGQANQIINDFNLQRKYNPDLGKAVGHIALNWSIEDLPKLNDEVMAEIAKDYLQKMKILNTQYLIVRHHDKQHPHLHIVYNRINNEGKTIPDNFQKDRNIKVCRELTLKYGFYISPGKEHVNRKQLKGEDKVKYELFDAIRSASQTVKNVHELKDVLAKQGIGTYFKYKSGTKEIQGISFSKGEYKFKGSDIDRRLSFAKLSQAIEQQQIQPEKSLADQIREAVKNRAQEDSFSQKSDQIVFINPERETQYVNELLTAGTDLLVGLLQNMRDDDDAPERKRRKKYEQNKGMSR